MTKLMSSLWQLVCVIFIGSSLLQQSAWAESGAKHTADFKRNFSVQNESIAAQTQDFTESQIVPDVNQQATNSNSLERFSQAKGHCPFGRTMRVAVVQGGRYVDFIKIFRNMVFNLNARRYMTVNAILNDDFDFTKDTNYQQLAEMSKGGCIELLPEGYYDGHWDLQRADQQFSALKERILVKKDVDLVWAFGTLAGKFFSKQDLGIPVMVIRTTDPESAGIVGSGLYSDKPNVHAQKEIERYKSEVKMFHDIFKFNSLGIVADESLELQEAQGLSIIKDFALNYDVKLQLCTGPVFKEGLNNKQDTLRRCALELAKTCDAVYVLVGNAETDETADSIQPLLDNDIPIFSQTGSFEVEHGMLMALADDSKQGSGLFEANVTMQIYHGISPDKIPQNHYASLFLTMNLEVAKTIGWEPSFEVLVAVDNVFPSIKRRQTLH